MKRYPGVTALDHVDFAIEQGEVRALLGKNGAGKSTLIRLLTGAELPDAGEVSICGQTLQAPPETRTAQAQALGVRAVYQELSLVPGMSIAENLFLGAWPGHPLLLHHREMRRRADAALGRLGIALDPCRMVASLSPAERQLVEIVRAMLGSPSLVILDEPTSSLPAAEVELLFRAIRQLSTAGVAVIYVSHRMNEIREIASAATVMRDGRVAGTVDVAQAPTRDIVRMMLGHDEQRDDLVEMSVAGPVCLSVARLCVPPKLTDISLDLRRGEVLGLAGLLGAGRTELLQTIAGIRPAASGTIAVDGEVVAQGDYAAMLARGLALTPENRKDEGIVPLLGVDENTVLTRFDRVSRGGLLSWAAIAAAARRIVERMQIKTAALSTPIGTLSGGNQQKVVIGRWVFAGSRILLLDEPTRGVDVESKSQIYSIIRSLAREGKSIIFVSSEIEELPKVCDRVLVLRDGRIAESFSAPAIDADTLMAAGIAGPGATSTGTIAA